MFDGHETGAKWRRSGRCSDGLCVEVAAIDDRVDVRTSAAPDIVLRLSRDQWLGLLDAIKVDRIRPPG